MEHNNSNFNEIYEILIQNVLAIPGVASIPKDSKNKMKIKITKDNVSWVIYIDINCFSYVNIWSVIKQVQTQAKYSIEKIIHKQQPVKININVFDLILEDNY